MANKITTVVDFVTDGAKSSLGSLKQSVADADGAGGKLKAGFKGVTDSIQANAGALAVGAGGALVAFGLKAVAAFESVAKESIDLASATGLSTEAASRWIAVGDDFQVSSEALATGLGKVAKTLDSGKWEKYGIATRDAGGNARDVNEILIDSFDKLSKVRNETERARIGQELFGKGYQSLTPILGHTREEYEKMLSTVEDGQVITDEEAKKAEQMRLAQDDLADALKNVELNFGQQLAALAPLVEMLAKYTMFVQQLKGSPVGGIPLLDDIDKIRAGWDAYFGDHDEGTKRVVGNIDDMDRANKDLSQGIGGVADATDAAKKADQEYKANSDNTKRAVKQNIDEMIGKWDELTGDVEDDKSWVTLQGQFEQVKQKFQDANQAITEGSDDAKQKTLEYQGSLDDLILSTVDYAKQLKDIPPEKVVSIRAALDAGDLELAEQQLTILTRNRDINIGLIGKGAAGYGGLSGARAGGGPVSSGGNYLVGENGPEVVHMGGSGTVIPNGALGGDVHVTINMPVGSNGDDVVRAIRKFEARNGAGWRS